MRGNSLVGMRADAEGVTRGARRSGVAALLASVALVGASGIAGPVAQAVPGDPVPALVVPPLVLRQAVAVDVAGGNLEVAAALLGLPPAEAVSQGISFVVPAGRGGAVPVLPAELAARHDLARAFWGLPAEPVVAEATVPVATAISEGTEGLDPVLARAFDLAAAEAGAEGVTVWITSGHRTYGEQQWLWEDGLARYGSPEAARQWVLPPEDPPMCPAGPSTSGPGRARNGWRRTGIGGGCAAPTTTSGGISSSTPSRGWPARLDYRTPARAEDRCGHSIVRLIAAVHSSLFRHP